MIGNSSEDDSQTAGDIKKLKKHISEIRDKKECKSRKQKQTEATWNEKCRKRRQMKKEEKVEKQKEKENTHVLKYNV